MRKERWSVSLNLILAWSQSLPAAAMRMFQLFYLHLLASLICSAVERGEATCTEGGRGRFGGGGSALREVEPTELLVRLFLECCLSCCSANTFSAISLIPMLSTMAKFSAINLYISTLKANSFLGHLRINGCVQTWLTQLSKDNSEWQISKSHWHGIHLSRATILGLPWPASPSKTWSVLVRFPNPLAAGGKAGNLSRSTQIGKHDLVKPQILSLNNVLLNLTAYKGQCGQKRHKSQILMPDKWYQWTASDTRKRTCILCLTLQFLRRFHSQLPCASQLAAAKDQSSVWHFHLRFGICDSYSKISSSLQLSLRNKRKSVQADIDCNDDNNHVWHKHKHSSPVFVLIMIFTEDFTVNLDDAGYIGSLPLA